MKLAGVLVFLSWVLFSSFQLKGDSLRQKGIEDFTLFKVGEFPKIFKTYPFQRNKTRRAYLVQDEKGNHYLRASDPHRTGTPIFRHFVWDARVWPQLSWRWRALKLPPNGGWGDCACGVFVIFGGYGGKSIKYIWSSNLPTGEVIVHDSQKYITVVRQSGSQNQGKWQSQEVNILEDYQKFFKSELKQNPSGFAILTDGDQTGGPSECDYDDFVISSP